MVNISKIHSENSNDIFSIQNYILKIQDLLDLKNKNELIKYVKDLHNADIADVIQNLNEDHRSQFILIVKDFFDPEILTYLNESLKDEIIEKLDIKKLASNVGALDIDDAVDVVEDLEESDQEVFLSYISESDRKLIEEGLNFPEDSAGRLMQRKFVAIDNSWNVGNTIDYLRKEIENLPQDFYDVYLIDKEKIVTGIVALGRLMSSHREIQLNKIQNKKNEIN